MLNKTCTICGLNKNISNFYFHPTRLHYESRCKQCATIQKCNWAKRNPDKVKICLNKRKKINKINHHLYYLKNIDKIKKRVKKYVDNNKELKRKRDREYYQKNKDKIKLRVKDYRINYYKKNKDKIMKRTCEYKKKQYKENPSIKIRECLRIRLLQALKNNFKKNSIKKYIGCTISFLKIYLESKFKKGMTWKNHGRNGWHIDHIVPCAVFDLTKEIQRRKCFHYTNLQPLWAQENRSKSDKIF